jgi:hypothetical protein
VHLLFGDWAWPVFELGEQVGNLRTHLATIDDHIYGAVVE